MTERTARRGLSALLIFFVAAALFYARAMPLFEAPDESSHLKVIHAIAREGGLPPPVILPQRIATGPAMAESLRYHDPPHYYAPPFYHALGALLTADVPMTDLEARLIPSPSWRVGWSPTRDADPWNKNVYVHLPGETVRESCTVRAAARLRALSLALSSVTLLCTYAIARQVAPQKPGLALGATAIVALNPQFIANAVSVSNDPLLNALFSLTLWGALRALRALHPETGSTRGSDAVSTLQWAALGALAGLALLTKQSALLLLPPLALAILWQPRDQASGHPWRKRLIDGAALGGTALLISGWWYLRNAVRYGDLLGLQPHLTSQMQLSRFDLAMAWSVFETYWAGFGWTLLSTPGWTYVAIAIPVAAGAAGLARSLLPGGNFHTQNPTQRRQITILALAVGLNAASLVRWAIATGAPYGRLLYPTIAATSTLLAWGWGQWRNGPLFKTFIWITALLAAVFAAAVPWTTLRPAFQTPHAAPDAHTTHLDVGFAETMLANAPHDNPAIRLVGYESRPALDADRAALRPGDTLRVTLYWQAVRAPERRLTTWIQLGPHDPTQRIAEDDHWLGGTRYPSDLWQAGDAVRDDHHLAVPPDAAAPGLYWLRLGLIDEAGEPLSASAPGGFATLGPWRVRDTRVPAPAIRTDARLGEHIQLQGYTLQRLEGTAVVTLTWSTNTPLDADYTVFVHLYDTAGHKLTQHDGVPNDGNYPTSWWLAGERVPDPHRLHSSGALSPSLYLHVGMYDPASGARLPAYDQAGRRLQNDLIELRP